MGGPVQSGPNGPRRHTKDKEPSLALSLLCITIEKPLCGQQTHYGPLESTASAGTSGMAHRDIHGCTTLSDHWLESREMCFHVLTLFRILAVPYVLCFIGNNWCSLGHARGFLVRLLCPTFLPALFGLTDYYSTSFQF